MTEMQKKYYDKRGPILVKNLQNRHFEAYYCSTREEALEKALSLIPKDATVGWGGTVTCQQIGLMDAVRAGGYRPIDRDAAKTPEERRKPCAGACWWIPSSPAPTQFPWTARW